MQFDALRFQPNRPLLKEITAERLNAVLAEIKKNRPKGERGITVRQSGDATFIGLASNLEGKTSAQQTTRPFEIQCSPSSDNENQFVVTVQPGTINNVLALNTFANGIDLTPFTIPADSLQYVSLLFKSNDGSIGESALSVDDKIPELQKSLPNSLPSAASVLLGVVYNGTIKQIVTDNLRAYGTVLYTTNKESGQTNNWYIWTWEHA